MIMIMMMMHILIYKIFAIRIYVFNSLPIERFASRCWSHEVGIDAVRGRQRLVYSGASDTRTGDLLVKSSNSKNGDGVSVHSLSDCALKKTTPTPATGRHTRLYPGYTGQVIVDETLSTMCNIIDNLWIINPSSSIARCSRTRTTEIRYPTSRNISRRRGYNIVGFISASSCCYVNVHPTPPRHDRGTWEFNTK